MTDLYTIAEEYAPETVLQPSLHSLEELNSCLLEEAEVRDVYIADFTDDEIKDEDIFQDILDRIEDEGYFILNEDDTILIYSLEDSQEILDRI